MSRTQLRIALLTAVVSAAASSAHAQVPVVYDRVTQQAYYAQPPQPKKIRINPNQRSGHPQSMGIGARPTQPIPAQGGYVRLDAPLYPVPRPNIPYQVGGTYITNQAFAPHEMLYPHRYRAMYPPFYYRVNGQWNSLLGTMNRYERWELDGTKVEVDYCSSKPLFSRFRSFLSGR